MYDHLLKQINELEKIALNPRQSILDVMKDSGKKAVGCFPVYAPEEIIYAAGLLPVGMWGGKAKGQLSDKYLQSFCCSIMKANMEQALTGTYDFLSGIVIPTFCDTLKCMIENFKAAVPHLTIIPVVYPQNRKIAAGKQFLKEELLRILGEMESISEKKVTEEDLAASLDLYDEYRKTMQEFVEIASKCTHIIDPKKRHLLIKASYFMDKRTYTQKMKEIVKELKALPEQKNDIKRIIMTGLIGEPLGMLDLLDENGMAIVADDVAQQSRQFRAVSSANGDAYERIADRIAMQDGCAFFYDANKTRGQMLLDIVKTYEADGILFSQLKFCDPEEFDYPLIKKEIEAAGVPMLYIEVEQQMDSLEQLRTRIQSFSEMLA